MNGTATQTLRFTWDLPFAAAKVWRGLTDSKLLARWLMENDMSPEPGNRFQFRRPPEPWWNGVVDCEVRELEPRRRLRYSWSTEIRGSRLDTVVTWTLTPLADGGTRLELEHSGFPAEGPFAGGAKAGWERMVAALGDVLKEEL